MKLLFISHRIVPSVLAVEMGKDRVKETVSMKKQLISQSSIICIFLSGGGGIVLKVGKKWFIRGIVSASLRDGLSCDVNSYAIFTDVAAFTPWIKNELKT